MLSIALGLILSSSPLILVNCSFERRKTLLTVISFTFILHLLIALSTQLFGVFNYKNIILLHFLSAGICWLLFFKYKKIPFKINFSHWLAPGLVFLGFLLILSYFINLHYNYTGPVRTVDGMKNVLNDFYPYPLYSDEWIGVAFVRSVFETQSLPVLNPLNSNEVFLNILVVFFSFTAHFFQLFGVDPLTHYTGLSLVVALGVISSTYLIVRSQGVNRIVGLFTASLVPLVINTTNIPGLLFYLPFTLSFLMLLLSVLSYYWKNDTAFYIFSLLCFLFYPPMSVFIISLILFVFWKSKKKILRAGGIGILGIIAIVLLISFSGYELSEIYNKILNLIFRRRIFHFHSHLGPWTMVTVPVFILFLVGVIRQVRDKSFGLISLSLVGLVFWFIGAFNERFFIIDHVRVIAITSLLLIPVAGIGLNEFYILFLKKVNPLIVNGLLLFLSFFLISSYYYKERWREIILSKKEKRGESVIIPTRLHFNRYLNPDDLSLFKEINHQNFLSHPWKSLIIGSATTNIPFDTKASTVTVRRFSYSHFMDLSCENKLKAARDHSIQYIYSKSFYCKGFEPLAVSSEDFFLFKVSL